MRRGREPFGESDHERYTAWLRAGSEPDWTGATDHRFVAELGSGAVEDDVFRRYLVQDYAVVRTLADVVGFAAGQAPEPAAKHELAGFLRTLTDEEDDYFERAFDALDVPDASRTDPERDETTAAFEDLLVAGARSGGYEETLAVLLPVEWVYRDWAASVADAAPAAFYHSEWIDLHAVPAFDAFVDWLRAELDRYGPGLADRRQRRVRRLFERAVALEVAFFDAAYAGAD